MNWDQSSAPQTRRLVESPFCSSTVGSTPRPFLPFSICCSHGYHPEVGLAAWWSFSSLQLPLTLFLTVYPGPNRHISALLSVVWWLPWVPALHGQGRATESLSLPCLMGSILTSTSRRGIKESRTGGLDQTEDKTKRMEGLGHVGCASVCWAQQPSLGRKKMFTLHSWEVRGSRSSYRWGWDFQKPLSVAQRLPYCWLFSGSRPTWPWDDLYDLNFLL